MRRSVAIASLALAWLCANGAVWDVVQVFAWGRMFANYAQTLSFAAAARETLDPNKPCELCTTVAKAKSAESKQAPQSVAPVAAGKFLFACPSPARFVFVSPPADWPHALASAAPSRTEPVPVPPPRV